MKDALNYQLTGWPLAAYLLCALVLFGWLGLKS